MNGFENLRRASLPSQEEDNVNLPSLPLGRLREGNMRDGELACWRSMEGHAAVVGATGRGKSAYVAIPWLLSHQGPAVAVDIKGELYRKTSKHRAELGPVVALDPFGVLPAHVDRACLNPMASPEGTSENDAQELLRSFAETVQPVGKHENAYWDSSAQNLIYVAALIARSRHGDGANPGHVNAILNRGKAHLMHDIKAAADASGTLGLAAGAMLGGLQVDVTFACYMLGASRAMMFLAPEGVAEAVSGTTVNPAGLMEHNGTLYLVMPEDKLTSHAGLVRMWLGSVLRAARLLGDNPGRNALFLVDEAGNLGNMREVMLALTLGRSKGVRLATFWQDRAQMRAAYGDEGRMFMSNSSLRLFLGTNDLEDSRYVSEVLGSDARGLPLLNPEQVRALPKGVVLACQDGMFPMALDALRSWDDEATAPLLGIAGEDWAGWCKRRLEAVTRPPEHTVAGQVRDGQERLFVPVLTEGPSPMMRAQRAVFDALRLGDGAPSGVTVIYDKARVPPVLRGDPYSPQVDVLVLDGARGVLLLEVKGGMLRWKPEEATWEVRTVKGKEWKPCKDPYEQVRACAYALVEALRREGLPYVHVRTAVAFPDMDKADGAVPADTTNVPTYWKGDLPVLWSRLGEDWKGGSMARFVRDSIIGMTYGQLNLTTGDRVTEGFPSPLGELPGDGVLLETRKSMVCALTACRHLALKQEVPAWAVEGASRRFAAASGLPLDRLDGLVERGLRDMAAENFLRALDEACGVSWTAKTEDNEANQNEGRTVSKKEVDPNYYDPLVFEEDEFGDLFNDELAPKVTTVSDSLVEGWKIFKAKLAVFNQEVLKDGNYVGITEDWRALTTARLDLARMCPDDRAMRHLRDGLAADVYAVQESLTLEEAVEKSKDVQCCESAVASAVLYLAWKKGHAGLEEFGDTPPPMDRLLSCEAIGGENALCYLNSLSRNEVQEMDKLDMVGYINALARGASRIKNEFEKFVDKDGKSGYRQVRDKTLLRPRKDWPTSVNMPRYATA